jgi:methionyl aminopeptidase
VHLGERRGDPRHTVSRKLAAGDIVSIDVGALYEGFYSDSARTFTVGDVTREAQRLMDTTEKALYAGIEQPAGQPPP